MPFSLKQRVQGHAIACAHETKRLDMMALFRPRRWSLMGTEQRACGYIEGVVGSVVPASLISTKHMSNWLRLSTLRLPGANIA